jgi:hypothetical protein
MIPVGQMNGQTDRIPGSILNPIGGIDSTGVSSGTAHWPVRRCRGRNAASDTTNPS